MCQVENELFLCAVSTTKLESKLTKLLWLEKISGVTHAYNKLKNQVSKFLEGKNEWI
jgi:hypothetical protein